MSLVADYTDSDDNSDSGNHEKFDDEPPAHGRGGEAGSPNVKNKNIMKVSSTVKNSSANGKSKSNFLMQEVNSSSSDYDSDNDNESEIIRSRKNRKQENHVKLSNPFRTVGDVNVSKEESVFRNPFREKEDQRIAVLEHHVKMTENPGSATTINGKKICWNYRKRKCYLGTQCPFAHDSDVPLTEEQLAEQKLENDQQRSAGGATNPNRSVTLQLSSGGTKSHLPATASVVAGNFDSNAFFSSPHLGGGSDHNKRKVETEDIDELEKQTNKSKKRTGLTNSLIPPKRALNLYRKTKDN